MKNLKINDYFQSFDLALATTLSLWFPIETIDKTNPQKAVFLFKREAGLEEMAEAFWKKELKVEPQAFFSQLKFIKSRLYGE